MRMASPTFKIAFSCLLFIWGPSDLFSGQEKTPSGSSKGGCDDRLKQLIANSQPALNRANQIVVRTLLKEAEGLDYDARRGTLDLLIEKELLDKTTANLLEPGIKNLQFSDDGKRFTADNGKVKFSVDLNYEPTFSNGRTIGRIIHDSVEFLVPLSQIPSEYLGIPKWESHVEDGFVVSGRNETQAIQRLPGLLGKTWEELEIPKHSDPDPLGIYYEPEFIGHGESLRDLLVLDNAYVVDELGLSHSDLAEPLKKVFALLVLSGKNTLTMDGISVMKVERLDSVAEWLSPFGTQPKSRFPFTINIRLTNEETGKSIIFSPLSADLIEQYGFYGGFGSPYRVEPQDIIDFFNLKPGSDRRRIDHAKIATELVEFTSQSSMLIDYPKAALWSQTLINRINQIDNSEGLERITTALVTLYEHMAVGRAGFDGTRHFELIEALLARFNQVDTDQSAKAALKKLSEQIQVLDKKWRDFTAAYQTPEGSLVRPPESPFTEFPKHQARFTAILKQIQTIAGE